MKDEPSLGLAPLLISEIFGIINKMRKRGVTVILVEQNLKAALSIADRGYVLQRGNITMADSAEKMLSNDEIRNMYLGKVYVIQCRNFT